MYLLVDCTDASIVSCGFIAESGHVIQKKKPAAFRQEEVLLSLIQDLFEDKAITGDELQGIIAVTGPGSFSALRISLSVVNTLAWSWGVPAIGFHASEFQTIQQLYILTYNALATVDAQTGFISVQPQYDREPNIGS